MKEESSTGVAWTGGLAAHGGERSIKMALYVIAVLLFWFAQYIFVPALPTYTQTKTTNLALVGVVLSMYGLWQAIIRVPVGIAADWAGWRKPFILVGLALSGTGAWLMISSGGVEGIALGRAITGVAAGAWVPLVVAFSALFPPEEAVRASAVLTLVNSLGRILATALAGPLTEWGGYPVVFYLAMIVSALSILTLLPLQEERRPSRRPELGNIRRLLGCRDVMLPSLLSAAGQYVNWAISFGFMVVLVKQFDGNSLAQGGIVTLHVTMYAVGNLIATTVANRIGGTRLLYPSFASIAFGALWAAFSGSLAMLFVAPIFIGLGMGLSYPVLMGLSIKRIADAERTTAMGLHQSIYAVGMFVGPAVSGGIADMVGIQPMFVVTAFACLAVGWGLIRMIKD